MIERGSLIGKSYLAFIFSELLIHAELELSVRKQPVVSRLMPFMTRLPKLSARFSFDYVENGPFKRLIRIFPGKTKIKARCIQNLSPTPKNIFTILEL